MWVRDDTRQGGFTLIELAITIAIIAIVAALAVPYLLNAKMVTNESAAIASMRNFSRAQVECINRGLIDIDGDGQGEYGFFEELSGKLAPRGLGGLTALPPLLSGNFRGVFNGAVLRSGYTFRVFLPDINGAGLDEQPGNYANVNPELAENIWCAYAWPTQLNSGGRRAFFVNQVGEILATTNTVQNYSGFITEPAADAVFGGGTITGAFVTGVPGPDGGVWRQLE